MPPLYSRIEISQGLIQRENSVTKIKATNITWHEGHVGRGEREKLLDQKGALIWMTGLSGSGKSTIAYTLEHALVQRAQTILTEPVNRPPHNLLTMSNGG